MRTRITIALAFSAAIFAGCHQASNPAAGAPAVASADISPNVAIKTAIQEHLAHNTNLRLNSFDMELKQVIFAGDHAQAQVEFHAKSGGGTMQLTYALATHGGVWSVVESTAGGSNFSHPGLDNAQAPGAGGTAGGDAAIFHALDDVRGGAVAPKQNLPPGHPPVPASPKSKVPQAP